jgi:hypothetical protein
MEKAKNTKITTAIEPEIAGKEPETQEKEKPEIANVPLIKKEKKYAFVYTDGAKRTYKSKTTLLGRECEIDCNEDVVQTDNEILAAHIRKNKKSLGMKEIE